MLEVINKTKTKVCRRKASRLQDGVLKFYHLENKEVSLVVVGDAKMKSLNRDFRGIDKTTDVLTFPADSKMINNEEKGGLLGEIFINIQEAKRTQKYEEVFKGKHSYTYIFFFLFVHGLLHLVGYDDKTESGRQVMIALGDKFMKSFFK